MLRRVLLALVSTCALIVAAPAAEAALPIVEVPSAGETDPVLNSGDAADDPAIWVHPTEPSKSIVIGTDKLGALEVYDLAGRRVQRWTGTAPNNVDVRGNLVATGDDDYSRMAFYRVDPASQRLSYVGSLDADVTEHGICMYQSRLTGRTYAYVTSYSGRMEGWEVWLSSGRIQGKRVRGPWWVGDYGWPLIEGCVADDATGHLYVGEERDGIWRYGAEPTASNSSRVTVDEIGADLVADVEGLAIAGGRLIASSQGDHSFVQYRLGDHAHLRKVQVHPGPSGSDGCSDTDGIDATSRPLGPSFPQGLFVCQDGSNVGGNQNFKFVRLEQLLGP